MSKITVLHHSADFDGLFCREIARKFLPDAELIGWNFGDPIIPWPKDAEMVCVMDLPIIEPFGLFLGRIGTPADVKLALPWQKIVWIDHHKSSIAQTPTDIPGYRIDGVAACRLAWQWFVRVTSGRTNDAVLPTKTDFVERRLVEPLAVRLAGEYDIWDKRDPDAELFQHGLRSLPLTDGIWDELLEPKNIPNLVEQLLERGETLQYARTQENASIIKEIGFTFKWEGLTFLCCNAARYNSHLFTAGLTPEHDACFGFKWTGKDWSVSLYHAPGKEKHDLSLIAVKYGGGGHRGACGFRTETLPFLK